jgi:flagellar biosynthesis/type III secretory pathway protein FliH
MNKEIRKKKYEEGYADAAKDLLDDKCLKQYMDGYKSGYRDGYQAAMEQLKMISTLSPEMKQKMMEDVAQGRWPPSW